MILPLSQKERERREREEKRQWKRWEFKRFFKEASGVDTLSFEYLPPLFTRPPFVCLEKGYLMLEKCPTRIPSFSLLLFPHFLSHASLSNRSLLRSSSLNFKDHIYSLPNMLIQSMPCFPPITVLFFYFSVKNPHMSQSHNSSLSLSKLCNQSYKLVLWPTLSFDG